MINELVVDVTQTLLNPRPTGISKVSLQILSHFHKKGIKFVVCNAQGFAYVVNPIGIMEYLSPIIEGRNGLQLNPITKSIRNSKDRIFSFKYSQTMLEWLAKRIDSLRLLKLNKLLKTIGILEKITLTNSFVFCPELILNTKYRKIFHKNVTRYSLFCHDLLPISNPEWFTSIGVNRAINSLNSYASADQIICNSKETFLRFKESSIYNELRRNATLEYIPLGSFVNKNTKLQSALERRNILLFVSSLQPRKNHDNLLKAIDILHSEGLKFETIFVSGDTWKSKKILNLIEDFNKRNIYIEVREKVSDFELQQLYSTSRLSAYISLAEGFGLPVLESLSCGTPVVTSKTSSMAAFKNLPGVFLVDPCDVSQIVNAIKPFFGDLSFYQKTLKSIEVSEVRHIDDFTKDLLATLENKLFRKFEEF